MLAKKSLIARNEKRKIAIEKYKDIRKELKLQIKDRSIPIGKKLGLISKLHSLKRDSSKVRLVPTCFVTGKSKGTLFYKIFGLSRNILRELVISGKIPGVIKVN